MLRFSLYYALLVGAYALLWRVFPVMSLLLFLLVSAYHFGQEQLAASPRGTGKLHAILWGGFVLSFPLLCHYEEARPIIEQMVRRELPLLTTPQRSAALIGLLAVNAYFILRSHAEARTAAERLQWRRSLLDLLLLSALYLSTNLLLGFSLFFLLWHSLPAAVSQWRYLQRQQLTTDLRQYLYQLGPLSLGAALGFVLFYHYWPTDPGAGLDLGPVFIFVSLITLPHALLMDAVYRR